MMEVRLLLALVLAMAARAPALGQSPTPVLAPPGASSCSGCHASPGASTAVPPLVGRSAAEIVNLMAAFRTGAQPSTVMDRIAKGFSESETEAIAAWYARLK